MIKNESLACPQCGNKYQTWYFRSKLVCSVCGGTVRTNLKIIGILETLIGFPILWISAALLRNVLHDSDGILSYSLLVFPALVVHIIFVRYFVKSIRIDNES